jgi:hypothetical protein
LSNLPKNRLAALAFRRDRTNTSKTLPWEVVMVKSMQ